MKIALIGPAHPYRGGLSNYSERLAHQFLEEGHSVVLVTFTMQYPDMLFPGKTQFSESPKPKHLNIVRKIHSINPFNWVATGFWLKKEAFDLIIIRYWLPFMGPAFGTILQFAGKQSVKLALLDNIIPHEKRPGDKIFTRYFVRKIDGFLAMTKSVLSDLGHFNRSKPRMLSPHPMFDNFGPSRSKEEAYEVLKLDPNVSYLLFFGFIRGYKGLDLLLMAMGEKILHSYDFKLLIAGEFYDDREKYEQLIIDFSLQERVILYDEFIPDDQVAYYFAAADLVAQPYRSATQSGVTQIAYHFEKPMIVTDVGGLAEMCPNGKVGYVVHPNPKSIAQGIYNFFQQANPDHFKSGIIEEKEKYTWDKLSQTFLHLYQQITTDRK